jgi:hypothetical protein
MGALMSQTFAPAKMRFKVEPRDIPAAKAARRLHLSTNFGQTFQNSLGAASRPPIRLPACFTYPQSISGWRRVSS